MTSRARQAAKITGGLTLASLMMFGDWLIEKTQHKEKATSLPAIVTQDQFRAESTRVSIRFDRLIDALDANTRAQVETNQRLREVCERLRAGCR